MICRETPSGFWTVARWPQLICDERRWRTLLPVAVAAVVVCVIVYLGFLVVAVASIARYRRASGGVQRGNLDFVASSFRDTAYYWGIVLTVKNIFVIVSPGIFRGQVPLQLWMCSVVLLAYAILVCQNMPWVSMYANFWDIALALLLMCQLTFISGSGFMGGERFDAMSKDSNAHYGATYHSREKWLLIICAAGLVFIAVQLLMQVCIAVPRIKRRLPERLLPLTDDRRDRFNTLLANTFEVPPALSRMIANMDEVEWHAFHASVASSSSTQGVVERSVLSWNLVDFLEGSDFQRASRRGLSLPVVRPSVIGRLADGGAAEVARPGGLIEL